MRETVTAEISRSDMYTELCGAKACNGKYIGIIGGKIAAVNTDCYDAACSAIEKMHIEGKTSVLIIRGKRVDEELSAAIACHARANYPNVEINESYGGQELYDLIIIAE